jgi:hypothetical protein
LKQYEKRIELLKKEKEYKFELISKTEDRIANLDYQIKQLEELQNNLPERHMLPWDNNEKDNLKKMTTRFIEGAAKNHKRTKIAIAARIIKEKWLLDISNGVDK